MRDPYKLLGVTPDASEEEIRAAHNFLLVQYGGDESSVEAIELAYEKIIMKSFKERKKAKMNLRNKLRKKVENSPSWVKNLLAYVDKPPIDLVMRRLFLFGFMAVWSVIYSAQTGPAFQVNLFIFFLRKKNTTVLRICFTGMSFGLV
jgi:Protein CHAPERONE-LIKE PROTEIN OF POR1-like